MSGWILVKLEGDQDVEIVHWGDLPVGRVVKLTENGDHMHLWERPSTTNAPGDIVTQRCKVCGEVRRV